MAANRGRGGGLNRRELQHLHARPQLASLMAAQLYRRECNTDGHFILSPYKPDAFSLVSSISAVGAKKIATRAHARPPL